MTLFIALISFLWFIRIVINLMSYAYLWYVKEYRFDRMLVHLKTDEGKRLLFIQWHRAPIRPKTIVLFVLSMVLLGVLASVLPLPVIGRLCILDLMTFPVTCIVVAFLKIPTATYHYFLIHRAITLLRTHAPMVVVGITGSYGKTSTKEIAATILGAKYKTLKTESSKNSPIGIAELVCGKLTPDHEIFVVEMGAYKIGEIAQMARMVQPQVGVITAINEQHQDLFGSIQNTMKAKYELIAGLHGKNIGIFNANNEYTKEMAKWARSDGHEVWFYTSRAMSEGVSKNFIHAKDIRFLERKISCTVMYKNQQKTIVLPLIEEHQIDNVLAGLSVALACGMTFDEIIAACKDIKPLPHIMQLIEGPQGALFIDDTFNNNPDAAKAAVSYLKRRVEKKILVFQPMIELGSYADTAHEEIGVYAASICDDIIVTNTNFFKSLTKGAKSVHGEHKLHVMNPVAASGYILNRIKRGDTVLFKGKESAKILHLLVHERS
ncbi:hypothetical protein A2Z00_02175 [Candidatus Gottesmanbacteria bacterium RBG_13_45_10]|uniref:UDP-N-acetylmuramoyl-tripeptide--D-alanyl-D-alanine ligase n=1 Tax=Candidatus Gottesmanbacteria bacterium RBG_13_45_10 TaxID=1798370 RepID=A0A1F5ZFU7_9BACT|nr:MAG: hypothetical protein A2Z00_02175 [Candidatus Gottesmanbacteria bacterium RBG_13_45_10]